MYYIHAGEIERARFFMEEIFNVLHLCRRERMCYIHVGEVERPTFI